jgi:hypothetical protein
MGLSDSNRSYRRHGLGVVAVLCLLLAIYLHFSSGAAASDSIVYSSSIRCGIILFLAWLAYPQLRAIPVWAFGGAVGFLLLIALLPRLLPALLQIGVMLLPVLFVVWLLRMKSKQPR